MICLILQLNQGESHCRAQNRLINNLKAFVKSPGGLLWVTTWKLIFYSSNLLKRCPFNSLCEWLELSWLLVWRMIVIIALGIHSKQLMSLNFTGSSGIKSSMLTHTHPLAGAPPTLVVIYFSYDQFTKCNMAEVWKLNKADSICMTLVVNFLRHPVLQKI